MANTSLQETQERTRRTILFRRAIVVPAEHGAWSWLLVPYLVGVAVSGSLSLSVVLVLTGGLGAFLMRQPATVWLRTRQGRGRRRDAPLAAGWTALFATIALTSLVGLLLSGHYALLPLLIPLFGLLLMYLVIAQTSRAGMRSLWMELAGAAGLAVMAPAAYVAGTGQLDDTGWFLWLLLAMQNAGGVLYVRLRLADRHKRPVRRNLVVLGHAAGFLLLLVVAPLTSLPWLTLVPFAAFLLRAAWAARSPQPLDDVKRFGFTEVAVELVSGIWLVVAYWLAG